MTGIARASAPAVLARESVLADYALAWRSRHASLVGRREVLTGKGKFGIFGDGKELPQLAMARAFRPGDFRSGYYRDQTFMMAVGRLTLDRNPTDFHTEIEQAAFEPNNLVPGIGVSPDKMLLARLFSRPAFSEALTSAERGMRK